MKYIRTKDGRILPANIATHELTKKICDAGYFKILDKGSYVTIGKEWVNFYGRWVDIIDEMGLHYSIKPNRVKEVTRELPQADTIERLCDEFVISYDICASDDIEEDKHKAREVLECSDIMVDYLRRNYTGSSHRIYGAIWIEGEHGEDILKSVAIMNEKGEFELL